MTDKKNSLTYAQAGVDIDAGNALVRAIAPLAKATRRPVPRAIWAASGAVRSGRLQFQEPVLVAANDGVGTKLKIAIEVDKHDTIGIDLVAMSVNDLVVQGAEPLFFLDYFATSALDVERARCNCRHCTRVPAGRMRAHRGRDGGDARPLRAQGLRFGRFFGRRG